MITLRPCRALLRRSFHSSSQLALWLIQVAVPSAWPRMTPTCMSSRLALARTSCAPIGKEVLSHRDRHWHAAQALAVLSGDALGCTDAAGEELSRV
eukprot:3307773-Pleurochrysis_carterae.AAC.1